MKRIKVLNKQVDLESLRFDGFYDQMSRDWEARAKELRLRRMRKLQNTIKNSHLLNDY